MSQLPKAKHWSELVERSGTSEGMWVVGLVLYPCAILLPITVLVLTSGAEGYWRFPLLAVSIGAAFRLWSYARRLQSSGALDTVQSDARPPILLLRGFLDDFRVVGGGATWIFTFGMGGRPLQFEEVICGMFARRGPVVAIGRPGELVPPLGAARFWVDDDHWQSAVINLLEQCQLVVMIMGAPRKHAGLTWEISTLFSLDTLEKVILVMPPVDEGEAKDRWEQYRSLSQGRLPEYCGGELVAAFGPDGKCQVCRMSENTLGPYIRDIAVYREAISTD